MQTALHPKTDFAGTERRIRECQDAADRNIELRIELAHEAAKVEFYLALQELKK